jgi:hypothetical protein
MRCQSKRLGRRHHFGLIFRWSRVTEPFPRCSLRNHSRAKQPPRPPFQCNASCVALAQSHWISSNANRPRAHDAAWIMTTRCSPPNASRKRASWPMQSADPTSMFATSLTMPFPSSATMRSLATRRFRPMLVHAEGTSLPHETSGHASREDKVSYEVWRGNLHAISWRPARGRAQGAGIGVNLHGQSLR